MTDVDELLSVIVPAYNAQEWLPQCLNSILVQTYRNLELIVVDDGSTDGTGELCDGYALRDPRVRVLHMPNGGPGVARKTALDSSRGGWVAFVDSDDWVEPELFGTLITGASEHGTSIAGGAPCNEHADGTTTNNFSDVPSGIVSGRRCNLDLLYQTRHAWGAMWNKAFRREVFDGIEFPAVSNLEDYVVMTKVYDKCGDVWFYAEPMYHHRLRDDSLSTGAFSECKLLAIDAAEGIRRWFAEERGDAEMVAAADSLVFKMYARLLWQCRKDGVPNRSKIVRSRRNGALRALGRYLRYSKKQHGDAKLLAMLLAGIA